MLSRENLSSNFSSQPMPMFMKTRSHILPPTNTEPMQGIKVTTSLNNRPAKTNKDDFYAVDPSYLANRYAQMQTSETFKPEPKVQPRAQNVSFEKMLFEKLSLIKKIRVIKTIESGENATKNISLKLEDMDENLDIGTNDDTFDLRSFTFEVSAPSSKITVIPKPSPKGEEEVSKGIQIKDLSLLRDQLLDVFVMNDNLKKTSIGKIEYKRWKYRIYDDKKKLMYKIVKGKSVDEFSQLINIKNEKGDQVRSGVVTRVNSTSTKCEIELEGFKLLDKLLIMIVMLSLSEQTKPLESATESHNPIKFLKRAMSSVLPWKSETQG